MAARSWRRKLAWASGALVLLLAMAGCKSWFGGSELPEDPMFLSRKPLEAKAQLARPVQVAFTEPAMPANPFAKNVGGTVVSQKKLPSPQPPPAAKQPSAPKGPEYLPEPQDEEQ